ncbi:MAG: hybrid sensor histidine kinase/response regulator [Candidatus Riflebacteria bacterium]|nr:hybrid sensor histidine kinase/response regulator [Candidatus Riflebacteria bacterium]
MFDERNLKILVVEDNTLVVEFIKKLCTRFGHIIVGIAGDGKTAVDLAASLRPDVILMDIGLPEMDGIAAAKVITENSPSPIIMLTSYDDKELVEKASSVGAGAYITKPINPDSLERAIIIARARFNDMVALRMLNLNLFLECETRRKAEEALKKSETQLKDANNSKSKLFSIVAHDLRSPIATLSSLLEIASDGAMDIEFRNSLLLELRQHTKNTLDLIGNLLEWARTQLGAVTPKITNLQVKTISGEVLELFEANLKRKEISVQENIPDSLTVSADREMFKTILRNLISNSIKFTPKLGKISILAEALDQVVEISVIDNGTGLSHADQNLLFNLATHHSTQGTEKEKGTGLGLILVKEMVEIQGGLVSVQSEVGKGSSFTFTLPRGN